MIRFQDPPEKAGRGRPSLFAEEDRAALRSRPGEWALYRERTASSTPEKSRYPGFEFTARKAEPVDGRNRRDIYVRFVGGES